MDDLDLAEAALAAGFANACVISTQDITYVPAFRELCAENRCGKYGVNYACPPDCGTVEEMRQKLLRYPKALVMQTMWDVDDPLNPEETNPAKAAHNRMTRQVIDSSGLPGLMVGVSGCSLCNPCAAVEGKPCRFPDKRYSCLSAYCVFVKELAQRCGMEYDCGPGIVAFFSLFCFSGGKK